MAAPVRRNFAHLTPAEQQAYVNAVRQVDLLTYADGVSYWDKQDQIHQGTHNHNGPSFIPWHRELCNRYEKLLQQVDPSVALHYWDWTQDPRNADDGAGGTVALTTNTLMGTASGTVAGTLAPLHNGDVLAGSRDATGNPADPPRAIKRFCVAGAPGVASDNAIVTGSDGLPQAQQWADFRVALESAHDTAHVFFGVGSNIRDPHKSFEDPFVFLLHANVDRLWATWQTQPGQEWRLDPDQTYGDESDTADAKGILHNLQPWDGTVEFGSPVEPWTGGSSEISVKNCRHPSVVAPPCYDTLPLTVEQVAPDPGQPIRFLDVYEGLQTARAFRLRVRGCRQVTANATLSGDPRFSLLSASVLSPEHEGYATTEALVWVLFAPGAAGSTASGTLDVTVPETGDTFSVAIEANVIAKPTVASCLVLDRSGSMDAASGLPGLTRMAVLRNAAPLFVTLLGDSDGVGVVRFDTDAVTATPVQVAGGLIGGVGRSAALGAIGTHATNPAGMTAIGDGIERAAADLGAVAGFDSTATVVFTDGHETEHKTISEVADLVTSRVYAIGLGTAAQLDPVALNALVDNTGGYLLLTGNPGPDDQLLLQKYFAQVLAGVTNADIVVDPDGFVPLGGEAVVPYDLTEAEVTSDVIVLSPAADAIDVVLEAPDGTLVDGSSGAEVAVGEEHQLVRVALAPPLLPAGRWLAHLKVDGGKLGRYVERLDREQRRDALIALKTHGLAYTLSVQARSSLHLAVHASQPSRRPGGSALLLATLTEAAIPLSHSAAVTARVTDPLGGVSVMTLAEVDGGVYSGTVPTPVAGVYRVLVRAEGATLRGHRFTREELRTLGAWVGGDDRPAPVDPGHDAGTERGPDWCRLLLCWLGDERLGRFLKERGIDPERLARCVAEVCG